MRQSNEEVGKGADASDELLACRLQLGVARRTAGSSDGAAADPQRSGPAGLENLEPRLLFSGAGLHAEPIEGDLSFGERQRYSFELSEQTRLYLDDLTNDDEVLLSLEGPAGSIYDAVDLDDSQPGGSSNPVLDLGPGRYLLTLTPDRDAASYSLRLLEMDRATPITPGTQVQGQLETGRETQLYRFQGAAGERVFLDLESVTGSDRSTLRVLDADGNVLETYNDSPTSSRPAIELERDGTHYVLYEGNERSNSDAPTDFAFTLYSQSVQPTDVALGETITGTIDTPGELDRYRLNLATDSLVLIDPQGDPPSFDAGITVRSSDGTALEGRFNDELRVDLEDDEDAVVRLPAGEYFLDADFGSNDSTGDYRFNLIDLRDPAATTPVNLEQEIAADFGGSTASRVFRFSATAGQEVLLEGIDAGSSRLEWRLIDDDGVEYEDGSLETGSTTNPLTLHGAGPYYLVLNPRGDNATDPTTDGPGVVTFQLHTPQERTFTLQPDTPLTGQFDGVGDRYRFEFELTEPRLIGALFEFDGDTSGSPITHADASGENNNDNNLLFVSSNGGLDARWLAAGKYQFTIDPSGADTGAFRVELVDLMSAATPADRTAPLNFDLGSRSVHVFELDAAQGDRFDVMIDSISGGEVVAQLISPLGLDIESGRSDQSGFLLDDEPLAFDGPHLLVLARAGATAAPVGQLSFLERAPEPARPTGAPVNLGDTISGTISDTNPTDDYRLTLAEPTLVVIDNLATDFDNARPDVQLPGAPLSFSSDRVAISSAETRLVLLPAGTHDLRVSDFGSSFNRGDYSFRLVGLGASPVISGTATQPQRVLGPAMEPYALDLDAGDTVLVDYEMAAGSFPSNFRVRLYDAVGELGLSRSLGFSAENPGTIEFDPVPHSGRYYLLFTGDDLDDTPTLETGIRVVEGPSLATTSVGQTLSGTLADGERRLYEFTLAERTRLLFDGLSSTGFKQWNLTGALESSSRSGNFADSRFGGREDRILDLRAGTYQLEISGQGGDFELGLTDIEQAGSPLSLGASASGQIGPAIPADVYELELDPGRRVALQWSISSSGFNDLGRIRVYDPNGEFVQSLDVRSNDVATEFTAKLPGTYRVVVASDGTEASGPESYTLTASDLSPRVEPLSLGQEVSDRIDVAGREHLYTFSLAETTTLYVNTERGDAEWILRRRGGDGGSDTRFDSRSHDPTTLGPSDYELVVFVPFGGTADYRFEVLDLGQAASASLGQSVSVDLDGVSPAAAISFDAQAGQRVNLLYTDTASFGSIQHTLLGPSGGILRDDFLRDEGLTFNAPATGAYTLLLRDSNAATGATLQLVDATDQPQPLTLGQETAGNLANPGERLIYDFTLSGDEGVYLDSLARLLNPSSAAVFDLLDAQNRKLAEAEDLRTGVLPVEGPGDYRLVIYDEDARNTGEVRFVLRDVAGLPLAGVGDAFTGSLAEGERDTLFRLPLAVGNRIDFDLRDGSRFDVGVIDPLTGDQVARGNANAPSVVPRDGVYLLRVEAGIGDYDFTLLDAGQVTPPDVAGLTELTHDAVQTGSVSGGTPAAFKLDLASDTRILLDELTGHSGAVRVKMLGPAGDIDAFQPRPDFGDFIDLDAGLYRVELSNFSGTNDYNFRLRDLGQVAATPLDTNAAGTLENRGDDLIVFDGIAGQRVYIDNAAGENLFRRPFFEIVGPDGSRVTSNNLDNFRYQPFDLPETGRYAMRIVHAQDNPQDYDLQIATVPTSPIVSLTAEALPDLEVRSLSVSPSPAVTGDPLQIGWSVANTGDAAVATAFSDRVRVINSRTGQTLLDTTVGYDPATDGNIEPGDEAARSLSFTLPNSGDSVGPLRVVVSSDAGNTIAEGNGAGDAETNNAAEATLDVTLAPAVDLAVSDLALSPATGIASGDTVTVSFTVTNNGQLPADAAWSDRIEVFNVDRGEVVATRLIGYDPAADGELAVGQSVGRSAAITIPDFDPGIGELEFRVALDDSGAFAERNVDGDGEANNRASLTAASTAGAYPNLVVQDLEVVESSLQSGDTMTIRWNRANLGALDVDDAFADEVIVTNLTTGQRVFTERITHRLQDGPVVAGSSQTFEIGFQLPEYEDGAGDYEVLVRTDVFDDVGEFDTALDAEADNAASVTQTVTLRPDPDLVVGGATVNSNPLPAGFLTVSWTLRNDGSGQTREDWSDRVTVSTDPEGQDVVFSQSFLYDNEAKPIDPGASVTRVERLDLPLELPAGELYARVETNSGGGMRELDTTNNTAAATPRFDEQLGAFPDLRVTDMTLPPSATLGQQIELSYDVTNQGGAEPFNRWNDWIFISRESTFDPQEATLLKRVQNPAALRAGQSYRNPVTVTVPDNLIPGDYFIFVAADYVSSDPAGNNPGAVFELNGEDNNGLLRGAIQVAQPIPPDLQVTRVETAIDGAPVLAGELLRLRYQVSNLGQEVTTRGQPGWVDRINFLYGESGEERSVRLTDVFYRGEELDPYDGSNREEASYTQEVEVRLPVDASGLNRIVIEADQRDTVNEYEFETNNEFSELIDVTATVPPDLVPEVRSIAGVDYTQGTQEATVYAGEAFDLTFGVRNDELPTIYNDTWQDRVVLSTSPSLDDRVQRLGTFTRNGQLDTRESYEVTASLRTDNDLQPGRYYVLVETDRSDLVYESDANEGNNVVAAAIDLRSRRPDLGIEFLSPPTTATAGESFSVSYRVTNNGAVPTDEDWADALQLLAPEGVTNFQPVGLGATPAVRPLDPGESYTGVITATIPFPFKGEYRLALVADSGITASLQPKGPGQLYEGGGDFEKNLAITPLTVERVEPDLTVSDLTAPAAVGSGSAFQINWSTRNVGGNETFTRTMREQVFISTRDDGTELRSVATYESDPFGASAKSFPVSAEIPAGSSSDRQRGVVLPGDMDTGRYYLYVATDVSSSVIEEEGGVSNLSGPVAIDVTRTAEPDLEVEVLNAPTEATRGGVVNVTYKVTNVGGPIDYGWLASSFSRDRLLLSLDDQAGEADTVLTQVFRSGQELLALGSGDSDQQTVSVQLPPNVLGSYKLIVQADSDGRVLEADTRRNNVSQPQPLLVSLAPPVDLVSQSLTLPATGEAGGAASLTYTVENASDSQLDGEWFDSLYLSSDDRWDLDDVLLARVRNTDPLAARDSYQQTVDFELPGVLPGEYRVIVRSDILNTVEETDETNNLRASIDQIELDATELTLGQPFSGTIGQGASRFFKVELEADQTLVVDLDGDAGLASELLVSRGTVPTRSGFDVRSDDVFRPSSSVRIDSTEADTYYILVFAAATDAGSADFTLRADTLSFGITDESYGRGGIGGRRTLAINGAKFDRETTATLVASDGSRLDAVEYWHASEGRVYATFDLVGVAEGDYALELTNVEGEVARLDDALEVVDTAEPEVEVEVISLERVAIARRFSYDVVWANRSINDVRAPLLYADSPFEQGLMPSEFQAERVIWFGAGDPARTQGPRHLLIPGDTRQQKVYNANSEEIEPTEFTLSTGRLGVEETRTFDWAAIRQDLQPANVEDARFDPAMAWLIDTYGQTWGGYLDMLADSAQALPDLLGDNRSLLPLYRLAAKRALAATGTSVSGRVFAREFDVELEAQRVSLRDIDSGRSYASYTLRDGSFVFEDVRPGRYRLITDAGVVESIDLDTTDATPPGDELTLFDVAEGDRFDRAEVRVSAGAEARGVVFDAKTGNRLPAVDVRAFGLEGESGGSDIGSNDGRFAVKALEAGDYLVFVERDGYARASRVVSLAEQEVVDLSLGLVDESVLRGTFDLNGQSPSLFQGRLGVQAFSSLEGDRPYEGEVFVREDSGELGFRIGKLRQGTYDVVITAADFEIARFSASVGESQVNDLAAPVLLPKVNIAGGRLGSSVTGAEVAQRLVELVDASGEVLRTTLTNDNGEFSFPFVPYGDYTLRVVFDADETVTAPLVPLTVDADTPGKDIPLIRGGSIAGDLRVDGQSVANIALEARGPAETVLRTRTNDAGRFEFETVPQGTWDVRVAGSPQSQTVSVGPANVSAEADLSLSNAQVISGTLRDDAGDPVAGAVRLSRGGEVITTAQADLEGRYQLIVFDAGRYELSATATFGSESFAPVTATVDPAATAPITRDLTAGTASLSVDLERSGSPVADASVRLFQELGGQRFEVAQARSDASGAVRFEDLAAGNYIVAAAGATLLGEASVSVQAGSSVSQTLQLEPGRSIVGNITAPTAAEPPVVQGFAYEAGTSDLAGVGLTFDGDPLSIDGLTPGVYDVVLFAEGFAPRMTTVDATAGSATLNATLQAATATVSGRAEDQTGRAIAGASVELLDDAGRVLAVSAANQAGEFTLAAPDGARVTLRVSQAGHAAAETAAIDIAAGANDAGTIAMRAVAAASELEPGALAGSGTTQALSLTGAGSGVGSATGDGALTALGSGGGPAIGALSGLSLGGVSASSFLEPPDFLEFFDEPEDFANLGGALADEALGWANAAVPVAFLKNLAESYDEPQTPITESRVRDWLEQLEKFDKECLEKCRPAAMRLIDSINYAEDRWDSVQTQISDLKRETGAALVVSRLELAKLAATAAGLAVAIQGLAAGSIGLGLIKAGEAGLKAQWTGFALTVTQFAIDLKNGIQRVIKAQDSDDALGEFASMSDIFIKIKKLTADLIGNFTSSAKTASTAGKSSAILQALSIITEPVNFFISNFGLQESQKLFKSVEKHETYVEDAIDRHKRAFEEVQRRKDQFLKCLRDCRAGEPIDDDDGNEREDDSNELDRPTSVDPNDILGPPARGELNWIQGESRQNYRIRFENDPVFATAPAQAVFIDIQLDDDLDWRTFRVKDFGIAELSFEVPENRPFYSERVDLTEEFGVLVDVRAGVDLDTGVASWTLQSIDPETGEPPADPLVGFLPINTEAPEGEGFVDFEVRPALDATTGTRIDSQARIVFDVNDPIDTPPIFRTLDFARPTASTLAATPLTGDRLGDVRVRWEGLDPEGSGLASFDVFVAENDGSFVPWLTGTESTEAIFSGTPGATYRFYAVARDLAGNRSSIPVTANASAFIDPGAPSLGDDTYTLREDAQLAVGPNQGVLSNDDPDIASRLEVSLLQGPDHGSLTLNADGSFTYTPDPEFSGADSFTYEATNLDNSRTSGPATVAITVSAVDDLPTLDTPASATPGIGGYTFRFDVTANPALSLGDIDGGGPITLVLASSASAISIADPTGLTVNGQNTDRLTLIGSLADLNAQLPGLVVEVDEAVQNPLPLSATVTEVGGSAVGPVTASTSLEVDPAAAAPPSVSEVIVGDGSVQRSTFDSLTVVFSRPLAELPDPASVSLLREGDRTAADFTLERGASADRMIVRFDGDLPEGNWTLRLDDTIEGDNGKTLPAVHTFGFHRLFGDRDGDADVDRADLFGIIPALGRSLGDTGFDPRYDFNGDDTVGQSDLDALRARLEGLVAPRVTGVDTIPASDGSGEIVGLEVRFARPLQQLDNAGVTVVDDAGNATPLSVTLESDNQTLRIDFDPQLPSGRHHLAIASDAPRSLGGVEMRRAYSFSFRQLTAEDAQLFAMFENTPDSQPSGSTSSSEQSGPEAPLSTTIRSGAAREMVAAESGDLVLTDDPASENDPDAGDASSDRRDPLTGSWGLAMMAQQQQSANADTDPANTGSPMNVESTDGSEAHATRDEPTQQGKNGEHTEPGAGDAEHGGDTTGDATGDSIQGDSTGSDTPTKDDDASAPSGTDGSADAGDPAVSAVDGPAVENRTAVQSDRSLLASAWLAMAGLARPLTDRRRRARRHGRRAVHRNGDPRH